MLTLKDFSTRHLLSVLDDIRRGARYYNVALSQGGTFVYSVHKPVKGNKVESLNITEEQIRDELTRREHIPTPKEAKAIRRIQAKAKSGLSYEEARKQYESSLHE